MEHHGSRAGAVRRGEAKFSGVLIGELVGADEYGVAQDTVANKRAADGSDMRVAADTPFVLLE